MKKQVVLFSLCMLLLTGCFFKKNSGGGTTNPQDNEPSLYMRFSMWDSRGYTPKSPIFDNDILVYVAKKAGTTRFSGIRSENGFPAQFKAVDTRGGQCEMIHPSSGGGGVNLAPIDLGMVGLQFPGSSSWSSLQKQSNGVYYGALQTGDVFPAGIYHIQTSGSEAFKQPFNQDLEMPEVLEDPALNGARLDNGPFTWDAGQVAAFSWKPSSSPRSFIQLQGVGKKNGVFVGFICAARESDWATGSYNVATEYLSVFTSDVTDLSVAILRGIMSGTAPESQVRLDIEGVRKWETAVTLQ